VFSEHLCSLEPDVLRENTAAAIVERECDALEEWRSSSDPNLQARAQRLDVLAERARRREFTEPPRAQPRQRECMDRGGLATNDTRCDRCASPLARPLLTVGIWK
jgi:hypothetical protein